MCWRCALFAILWSLVRDTELVLSVLAGVLAVGLVLTLAGFGLVRLTGRLRGGVGVAWRYGLANVSRRGGGSVVQIVAFGLGLMVLLLLAVVRGDLLADWRRSLPGQCPEQFSDQYPARGTPASSGVPAVAWNGQSADVSHGACAHDRHQFASRRDSEILRAMPAAALWKESKT